MEAVAKSAEQNIIRGTQKKDHKYIVCMCVLFSVLIVGRALNDVFFYLFAGVSLIVFLLSNTKRCIPLLLFLLPFASLLKTDVESLSFFTILFFLVILKLVVARPKIHGWLLAGLLFFFTYNLLFSGFGQLTTIATMIAGMLMLYYLRYQEIDTDVAVMTFSVGICLASVLALLKSSLPIINVFVTEAMLKLAENEYISRFSGLQGNPNYYTLDITMALSAIIVIICNSRKIKLSQIVLIALLSIFGIMSVSKSFLIVWALMLLCWFAISLRQGANKTVKFVLIALISAGMLYYFAYDSINAYVFRLAGSSFTSITDATSGRVGIWLSYIEIIFDDLKVLFFGNGLNTISAEVRKGTHNTYLECIFNLGILGSAAFLALLETSMGIKSYKNSIWLPVILLLARMFAIGILTYDNLWFYFLIIVILSKKYNQRQLA